jgi:hypothetical protein
MDHPTGAKVPIRLTVMSAAAALGLVGALLTIAPMTSGVEVAPAEVSPPCGTDH